MEHKERISQPAEQDSGEVWALVEIMGHQRIAGKVSEYNLGGTFIRVDVPPVKGRQGFTKLFGPQSIYAISFIDEDVCRALAEKISVAPVQPYEVAQLTKDAVADRLRMNSSGYLDYDQDDVI